eukprot:30349_1
MFTRFARRSVQLNSTSLRYSIYGKYAASRNITISKELHTQNTNYQLSQVETFKYLDIDDKFNISVKNVGKKSDCVITTIGDSCLGRSTLLNILLQYFGYNSAFTVRTDTFQVCTKGIDMAVIRYDDKIFTLRDCEGLTHCSSHYSMDKLVKLSYITSDILIWNLQIRTIQDQHNTKLITDLLEFINNHQKLLMIPGAVKPVLIIVGRDEASFITNKGGSLHDQLENHGILKPLQELFMDIITVSLPMPSTEDMTHIEKNTFVSDNDYESAFKSAIIDCIFKLFKQPSEKKIIDDIMKKGIEQSNLNVSNNQNAPLDWWVSKMNHDGGIWKELPLVNDRGLDISAFPILTMIGSPQIGKSLVCDAMLQYYGWKSIFSKSCKREQQIQVVNIPLDGRYITLREYTIDDANNTRNIFEKYKYGTNVLIWNQKETTFDHFENCISRLFADNKTETNEQDYYLIILGRDDTGSLEGYLTQKMLPKIEDNHVYFKKIDVFTLPVPSQKDKDTVQSNQFYTSRYTSHFKNELDKFLQHLDILCDVANFQNAPKTSSIKEDVENDTIVCSFK